MVSDRPVFPRRILAAALVALLPLAWLAAQEPGTAASAAESRYLIDLTALEAYVRPGFALEWTYYEPARADAAWTRVAPKPGNRPIVARDLPIPGLPKASGFATAGQKAERYTIVIAFDAPAGLVDSQRSVGLYFRDIGKNWEVYLNGSVIASEVYLSRSGVITRERAVHGALVDVDKRFLKAGRNILAVEVLGDRSDYRTGFFAGGPFLIGDYRALLSLNSEYLDLMLIGIYVFFGLYHLILFALRPANRPYLFYGLGTLSFALYLFARSFIVFDLIPDTAFIRGIELASLFVFFPLFMAFFDTANRGKVSLFTWIFGGASFVLALVAPVIWGEMILKLWQFVLPLPMLYLLAFDCVIPTFKAIRETRLLPRGGRWAAFARRPEFWTLVIAYGIGLLIAVAALASLNSEGAFTIAKFGAFFLIFGTATVLAGRFTGLYRDVEGLNLGLERRVHERTSALEKAMAEQEGLNASLSAASQELEKTTEAAERDRRIAVQVQRGIFPQVAPETSDWELAFVYRPVKDVSGDFYDFYTDSGRLAGVVLGDVSGHGISSGLITVLARSVFYGSFRGFRKASLGRVVEEISAGMAAELATVENFLTASFLRMEGGGVEYVNAANTDLAFRRAGKARANLVLPEVEGGFKGPPLGPLGRDVIYRSVKFQVASGDSLLLYTDSLRDAADEEGTPFGTEGILAAYGLAPADSAADMLEYIIEEWEFHRGEAPVSDDLTAIILRKK